MLWITWQASTATGSMFGALMPASWELDFTLALTLIAIVVPMLNDRAALTAALPARGYGCACVGFAAPVGADVCGIYRHPGGIVRRMLGRSHRAVLITAASER